SPSYFLTGTRSSWPPLMEATPRPAVAVMKAQTTTASVTTSRVRRLTCPSPQGPPCPKTIARTRTTVQRPGEFLHLARPEVCGAALHFAWVRLEHAGARLRLAERRVLLAHRRAQRVDLLRRVSRRWIAHGGLLLGESVIEHAE